MISEIMEAKDYLEGKNISKKNLYRTCYLLAKLFKEQGLSHVEIRNSIFEWANQFQIQIKYNLNAIIYKVLDDKDKLKDITIKINQGDIEEIKKRFDSRNTRLVALALLCYAKAYADKDKSFRISTTALSSWIQINVGNLSGRHMKELIDFGYITKLAVHKNTFKWDSENVNSQYRINVDIHNSGNHLLDGNDILGLYSLIEIDHCI